MEAKIQFMAATVLRDDLVFISAQLIELNRQGIDHTKMLRWKNDTWAHYMVDWPTISLASQSGDGISVLALDPFGRVHVAHGSKRTVEHIDLSREGPNSRGPMREIRKIDGSVYAVGMQRQAYRRVATDQWRRMDSGVVMPLNSADVKSFDSIDGFSESDIYAVGMDGEIWRWSGVWSQCESPTSVALEKVLCAPDGNVFVAGQVGTLLVGREDKWTVVESGDLDQTIWDLAWFGGRVYASTNYGLYVVDDGVLARVDTRLSGHVSFGNLATNGTTLWSVGRTQLAHTMDGVTWKSVECLDLAF